MRIMEAPNLRRRLKKGWPKIVAWSVAVAAVLTLITLAAELPEKVGNSLRYLKGVIFKTHEPAFSALAAGAMLAPRPENSMFVFLHAKMGDLDRKVLSPIHLVAYVQFTNLRTNQMMIGSYAMEGKMKDGTWVEMPSLDMTGGTLYSILSDNKRGGRIEVTTFQSILIDKTIMPNETVQGWIFLGFLPNGPVEDFRFHIRTTTGNDYTEPFNWQAANHIGTISQHPAMVLTPDIISFEGIEVELNIPPHPITYQK